MKKVYKRVCLYAALAAASLPVCAAAAVQSKAVDIAAFQPAGFFDTAGVAGKMFRNTSNTDARYSGELRIDKNTPLLSLFISAELAHGTNNAVFVNFGSEGEDDLLRIGCENGQWSVCFKDQLRSFSSYIPPPLSPGAENKFRLVLTADSRTGSAEVWTAEGDAAMAYDAELTPEAGIWQGQDLSMFTRADVSLRGDGAGIRLSCWTYYEHSFIILR